jgi:hypothetical protein
VQRAIQRAVHRIDEVDALDGVAGCFRCNKLHIDVNAADDHHVVFRFHFAGYVRDEFSITGINLARFQRTSEGAHHSTSGGGDNVINGGGVRIADF